MLTTVKLDGELGERFGKVWELDLTIPSPKEALQALLHLAKGFREYLQENAKTEYVVYCGERDLCQEELLLPSGRNEIRIMPALTGAKSGGVIQMIVGAVLIVVGLIITGGIFGMAAPFGSALIMMGISMMVGGLAQLLFAPDDPSKSDMEKPNNRASYLFNGPVNTTGQGNCVAVCYGEVEVGSQVISAGIFTEEKVSTISGGGGGGIRHYQDGPYDKWEYDTTLLQMN